MLLPNIKLEGEFAEFEDLICSTFPTKKTVKKGDVILSMAEGLGDNYFYLKTGTVTYYYYDRSGRREISTLRGAGTIFPLFVSEKKTGTPLEAVAREEVELVVMPRAVFTDFLEGHPKVSIAMLDAYGKYATYLLHSLHAQVFGSTRSRICAFLLLHKEENSINITHEELAGMTGTTLATASRTIADLKKQGIVSTQRGSIQINDSDRLLKYARLDVL